MHTTVRKESAETSVAVARSPLFPHGPKAPNDRAGARRKVHDGARGPLGRRMQRATRLDHHARDYSRSCAGTASEMMT